MNCAIYNSISKYSFYNFSFIGLGLFFSSMSFLAKKMENPMNKIPMPESI
ncbi:hypothetical protein JCM19274_2661 [Algibacter lectus]|uniref:Uncharacterized protein n=1 Tax=Algibacter lectus TaxID=221126 RepID=A0A090WX73_9FLAO|nr:hypothetical protein JCM19274_2661 [Algibacter lectus]